MPGDALAGGEGLLYGDEGGVATNPRRKGLYAAPARTFF